MKISTSGISLQTIPEGGKNSNLVSGGSQNFPGIGKIADYVTVRMGIGIENDRNFSGIGMTEYVDRRIGFLTLLEKSGSIHFDRAAIGLNYIQHLDRVRQIAGIVDQPEFFRQIEVSEKVKFFYRRRSGKFLPVIFADFSFFRFGKRQPLINNVIHRKSSGVMD